MHSQIGEGKMTTDDQIDMTRSIVVEQLRREGPLERGDSVSYHRQFHLPPEINFRELESAITGLKRDGIVSAPEVAGPIVEGDARTPRVYLTLALRD